MKTIKDFYGHPNRIEKDYLFRYTQETDLTSGKFYDFKGTEIVFEVGAYIGIHAVRLSECVPNGRVIAIEPDIDNYKYLLKNAESTNITTFNCACSDTNDTIKLYKRRNQIISKYFSISRGFKRIKVKTRTIDSICKELNLVPDFLRIQVNGAELDVLTGMKETLKQKPGLMIAAIYNKNARKVKNILEQHGYIPEIYGKGNVLGWGNFLQCK